MSRIIPPQVRSVDPYASYHSNIVNRLTRLITDSKNIILKPDHFSVSIVNTYTISVSSGIAVIDDVMIHIPDTTEIDLTNPDAFYGPNHFSSDGYYYVILDYQYIKSKPAPQAGFAIIAPNDINTLFNENEHLLIAVLHVNSSTEIDAVYTYDPNNPSTKRTVSSLSGIDKLNTLPTWTPSWEGKIIYVEDTNKFYAADDNGWIDILSPTITGDNIDSGSQPFGQIIVSDGSGGSSWQSGLIAFKQEFASATDTWVINHNLNSENIIAQFFDNSTPPKEIVPEDVEITSANTITATFSDAVTGKVVLLAIF